VAAAPRIFERRLVRQRAARASQGSFLLEHVAADLCDRLAAVRRDFALAVDLGSRGPQLGAALVGHTLVRHIVRAVPDPRLASNPGDVVADEEALPFRDGSLDLVVSSLSLQLVNDLPGALIQVRRALKADGLLLASLLGGRTLHELREALAMAETEVTGGAGLRVAPFADVRDLGQLLSRAGFALPVADSEALTVTYASALGLMDDLRAMGFANALIERSRRPLRRDVIARMAEIYAERFPAEGGGGRIRATFEIVTLTGWAPHPDQQKPLPRGSAGVALADFLTPRGSTRNAP
jgi:SAM-dependent methyltransferase